MAKIQELFDIELFGFSWNDIISGNVPDQEKILLYSKKYKIKNLSEVEKDYLDTVKDLQKKVEKN